MQNFYEEEAWEYVVAFGPGTCDGHDDPHVPVQFTSEAAPLQPGVFASCSLLSTLTPACFLLVVCVSAS